MDDRTTLERAIKAAIERGWTVNDWTDDDESHWEMDEDSWGTPLMHVDQNSLNEEFWLRPNDIIFNHDFAKALWSEGVGIIHYQSDDGIERAHKKIPHWEYRLQQMVIADDPIKYLADNMPEAQS